MFELKKFLQFSTKDYTKQVSSSYIWNQPLPNYGGNGKWHLKQNYFTKDRDQTLKTQVWFLWRKKPLLSTGRFLEKLGQNNGKNSMLSKTGAKCLRAQM